MLTKGQSWCVFRVVLLCISSLACCRAVAEPTVPMLETVFPAGGQAGQSVDLTLAGSNLDGLRGMRCSAPGVRCEVIEPQRVRLSIPGEAMPGSYELWAVCENGFSSPRTFVISNRSELNETEPNQAVSEASSVPLNCVVNGRIEIPGDQDFFRFDAMAGQRVIIECSAERIDSRLRAVLAVFRARGERLAVNRGYFGIDPLIDFQVPADGAYVVGIQDLTLTGGAEHTYRLEIDTGPRVVFARPNVIERGKATRVELFGWNLSETTPNSPDRSGTYDRVEVGISAASMNPEWPLPARMWPAQVVSEGFAWHYPGSHSAVICGITDVPVVLDNADNHSPGTAQSLQHPCEVSGQLSARDEQDWFAVEADRGEVLFIEARAQRIGSPVDLEISLFDETGQQERAQFSDEVRNIGGKMLPTSHLDPGARCVVPTDGRFLINVRNLSGGASQDARRIYRLSVRREEPDLQLVAIPRRDGYGRVNLRRGGREVLDIVAFRQHGLAGSIRITARDLPPGVECPDVSLGPGVDRAVMVVSADQAANETLGELKLFGVAGTEENYPVRGASVVRTGTPNGWSRLASQIPLAVVGDAPIRITANGHEVLRHHLYGTLQIRHSPGGILDVAVQVDRRDPNQQAPVRLSGVGVPDMIRSETAVIPAGHQKGYLSFCLPPTLATGTYSLAVQAETTVPTGDKSETVVVHSNAVTFEVKPEAFLLTADPFAPKTVRRGETFQVGYTSERRNGFIGKMHTELAAPGIITDVPGLRGRGETFTGQTDQGSLQIVVNDDAPLGPQQSLRLFTVGVVEDQPTFFGSRILPLEIVE